LGIKPTKPLKPLKLIKPFKQPTKPTKLLKPLKLVQLLKQPTKPTKLLKPLKLIQPFKLLQPLKPSLTPSSTPVSKIRYPLLQSYFSKALIHQSPSLQRLRLEAIVLYNSGRSIYRFR
jgi:hypothetical protein